MKLVLGSLLVVALFVTESLSSSPRGAVGDSNGWVVQQGGIYGEDAAIRPGEPAKCFDKKLRAHFSDGEQWRHPDACTKITCTVTQPDALQVRHAIIETAECTRTSGFPSACHLTTPSLHAIFPYCCPQVECNGQTQGHSRAT